MLELHCTPPKEKLSGGSPMLDEEDQENPDRMTPGIAVLGYGSAAAIVFLLFWLAASVTG
jgi:hypothetical protein